MILAQKSCGRHPAQNISTQISQVWQSQATDNLILQTGVSAKDWKTPSVQFLRITIAILFTLPIHRLVV